MPARTRAGIRAFLKAGAARRRLGVPDDLVGEEDDVAFDPLGVDEAHRFLVAGLAEEALAGAERDREDPQPQLVDEVVLHQRVYELEAGGYDDFPVQLLLQLRDRVHCVALEDRRVAPVRIFEGGGNDVLGHAVQPVRQLATPRWPSRGQPLVAPPTKQQGLCAQRLVERELAELRAVLDQSDPAADPEALVTGRVLDDPVEGDVVADDDPSHFDSPFRSLVTGAGPASIRSSGVFGGPPRSRSASARPIPASTTTARNADWKPSFSTTSGFAPSFAAR